MKEFLSKRGLNPDNWRYLKYIPNKELIIVHKHALNPKVINLEGIWSEKRMKKPSCTDCIFCQVDDTWNLRFCTENGFRLIDDGTEEAEGNKEPCDSFIYDKTEKPIEQPEHCPSCDYEMVSEGKHVCCFACGYNA